MARPRNPLGSVQLRFSGNHLIEQYLTALVQTGLYGRSPGEAAERLVSQSIEKLVQQGVIHRLGGDDPTKR